MQVQLYADFLDILHTFLCICEQFEKTCRWIAGFAISKQLRKGMSWHIIYLVTSLYYHFWGIIYYTFLLFLIEILQKLRKIFFGFPDGLVGKESTCNEETLGSIPGLGRSAWKGIGYPFQYSWASLVAQLIKNLPAIYDLGSICRLGRSPGEGNGCPLQYSGLENSMDLIVHGSHKESDTTDWLSLVEIYLIYNMLISAIQQSDSIYIYAFFF